MLRLRAAIEAGSGNTDAANKDLQEALSLAPSNANSLLNYGSLQWKLGQKDAAQATFSKVLELDPRNRTALSSLGYLARDSGDSKLAENYFTRAVDAHPKDFAPYLALGDLYTAERNFQAAQKNYESAYRANAKQSLDRGRSGQRRARGAQSGFSQAVARSRQWQDERQSASGARTRTLSSR